MSYKIGVVSQKGGVGKSTLARAIGTAYAAAEWNVKIADLDLNQSTSYTWLKRRLKAQYKPYVPVEVFGTVPQALNASSQYDLMVLDGAPHASKATVEIGKAADLIIIPTGLSLDDMEPTVLLANNLRKEGVQADKISIALCRIGDSQKELDEAKEYLSETPYHVFPSIMPEKTAYRRASDAGLSATETPYKAPAKRADQLVQNIIDRLEELTK